jgi:hypothetical protein
LQAKEPIMTYREVPAAMSGRNARQGRVVLRTAFRNAIFIAGLAGIVVLAVLLAGCIPATPA